MSLYDKRMPSLRDKHVEQAQVEVPKLEVEESEEKVEVNVKKGRRLNK